MMKAILRNLIIGLLSLLAMAMPAMAAPADDLAAAMAMPRSSSLVGAERAERFAWIVYEAGVRNIWVGGPAEPARQVTHYTADNGVELYDLALSADGRQLAFVVGGDGEFPEGGLPNTASMTSAPEQQVMIIDLPAGRPRVIGEGHAPVFAPDGTIAFTRKGTILLWRAGHRAREVAKVSGRIGNMRFSPDGTRLLFVDDRGSHSFLALFDRGSEVVRYPVPGLSYAADPTFSPDGSKVATIRYREPPARGDDGKASYWTIDVANADGSGGRTVWAAPADRGGRYGGTRQQNLYWTADNRILFPWERDGWMHVYAIPADGSSAPLELTPGNFEVETFLLAPDQRTLLFVANVEETGTHRLWQVRPGGKAERVTQFGGIESYPAIAGKSVALVATDETHPAHIVLANGAELGSSPELTGTVSPQPVTFTAEDGMLVHGQLFEARGTGPHPAMIFVHGGPRRQMLDGFHPSGYYSNAYIMNQWLASQGFNVLAVNYRSGTGYGLAFRDAPGTARDGAAEYRDILAAGKWLAARSDVDPRRIGIWGGSWGGYLAALALARDSDLFAAGVDFHGVHTMLRTVPNSLSPEEQAKARQLQWDSSPFGALDSWRSPVLIIHGDDDKNVPFWQSVMLAQELAARGIPFEELVFPNERHSFLRHADWMTSYFATADFLKRHLAPTEDTP